MKLLGAHSRWLLPVGAAVWSCVSPLAAIFCAAGASAMAQPATPVNTQNRGVRETRLYGIASSRVLNHVNRDDARAALKVWFDVVGQQRGFILDSKVDVADSATAIRERLQSHSVDLLVLDATEYLELESSHLIVPVLTHARGLHDKALYSYVLLVAPSSAATTIASLRGKNILAASRNGSNTGAAETAESSQTRPSKEGY